MVLPIEVVAEERKSSQIASKCQKIGFVCLPLLLGSCFTLRAVKGDRLLDQGAFNPPTHLPCGESAVQFLVT